MVKDLIPYAPLHCYKNCLGGCKNQILLAGIYPVCGAICFFSKSGLFYLVWRIQRAETNLFPLSYAEVMCDLRYFIVPFSSLPSASASASATAPTHQHRHKANNTHILTYTKKERDSHIDMASALCNMPSSF